MTMHLESYGEITLINYIDLTDEEKIDVLTMRNHPEIQKWMYTQSAISQEAHLKYIDALKDDTSKRYFLVRWQEKTVGTINFKEIDPEQKSVVFALYSNPFDATPGVGRVLEEISIRYAFDILGLDVLMLEVFATNKQVINLHKKYGFIQTGTKNINGQEVLCMQLNKENRR